MKATRSRSDLQSVLAQARQAGRPIHFVPTMGALHAGHLSLVEKASHDQAVVVVSIYVNPTQFNQAEDLALYPRQEAADLAALSLFDQVLAFLPDTATIYASGTEHLEHHELGLLENLWEGRYRPGHFQGVCQVVSRLLEMVQPDKLFLGQKDYQQCLVLEKMMREKFPTIAIERVPTLRAASGLALSSRNQRLSPEGLAIAPLLYQHLQKTEDPALDFAAWQTAAQQDLLAKGFDRIDYLALVDAQSLEPMVQKEKDRPSIVLAAAYLEGIRLIDNLPLTGKA